MQDVGEEDGVSHPPVVVLFRLVADEAALDDAVVRDLEPDLPVVGAARADARVPEVAQFGGLVAVHDPAAPVAVEPLEVERVERVLVALEPVARNHDGLRAADARPDEDVDAGEQGRGVGAHVGEDGAAQLLCLVRLDAHLLLELGALRLRRLVDALAGLVEYPAVVGAADAVLLGDAVGEVGLAVRARGFDEADSAAGIAVEDEVLAQQAHFLRGVVGVELDAGGDGVPVAPHKLAHRRSGAYASKSFVLLRGKHEVASSRGGSALNTPSIAQPSPPAPLPPSRRGEHAGHPRGAPQHEAPHASAEEPSPAALSRGDLSQRARWDARFPPSQE